jgi:hypothetical protein
VYSGLRAELAQQSIAVIKLSTILRSKPGIAEQKETARIAEGRT